VLRRFANSNGDNRKNKLSVSKFKSGFNSRNNRDFEANGRGENDRYGVNVWAVLDWAVWLHELNYSDHVNDLPSKR
jgi:hypothetical protein